MVLGGGAEGSAFWPEWLARDVPGLTTWTLAYKALPTNWLGTATPIQDRAKNVLECLLAGDQSTSLLPVRSAAAVFLLFGEPRRRRAW